MPTDEQIYAALSPTDICNVALAGVGSGLDSHEFIDDFSTDETETAELCRRFYARALNYAIEDILPKESVSYESLTLASGSNVPANMLDWDYAFIVPAGHVIFRVVDEYYRDINYYFESVAGFVYCQVQEVRFLVSKRITDTTKFTEVFAECVALQLLKHIAKPLLGNDDGRAVRGDAITEYQLERRKAKRLTGQQSVLADGRGDAFHHQKVRMEGVYGEGLIDNL